MRLQLSLYAHPGMCAQLEDVRLLLDPVQSSLIPAHVTLCREEELTTPVLQSLRNRLAASSAAQITLVFGPAQPIGEHGILLPCIHGEQQFQELRELALGRPPGRLQRPHITLAHPRNPKAPGNHLADAAMLPHELRICFDSLRLIEQHDAEPWRILEVFELGI